MDAGFEPSSPPSDRHGCANPVTRYDATGTLRRLTSRQHAGGQETIEQDAARQPLHLVIEFRAGSEGVTADVEARIVVPVFQFVRRRVKRLGAGQNHRGYVLGQIGRRRTAIDHGRIAIEYANDAGAGALRLQRQFEAGVGDRVDRVRTVDCIVERTPPAIAGLESQRCGRQVALEDVRGRVTVRVRSGDPARRVFKSIRVGVGAGQAPIG